MIVLDANVLIAHFDDSDALHDRATALLTDVADDTLGASVITLAEVLTRPTRVGALDRALARIRDLDVTSIGLDADAPTQLAALRVAYGLRLPDCCVLLATDIAAGALATFDERLAAAGRRRGLVVHD